MLTEMLRKAVDTDPHKTAIVQGGRRIRYDELDALAGRCAGGLRRLGAEARDCVAVALPNCPEFVACLFACARLRAVMLPLNPLYKREELLRLVVDARARIVITDAPRASSFTDSGATVTDFEALVQPVAEVSATSATDPVLLSLYVRVNR